MGPPGVKIPAIDTISVKRLVLGSKESPLGIYFMGQSLRP